MAKSQLNVYYPKNLESDIEAYRQENDLESKSEAGRQLLRHGVDKWQNQVQDQDNGKIGGRVLTRGAEIAFIAALFAAILAIGVDAPNLYGLAAGFGLIAIALYGAYGALIRYRTGGWGGIV